MADRIFAGLTLKQLAILGADAVALLLLYLGLGTRFHLAVFIAAAIPTGISGLLLATSSHNGIALDRLLVSAIRYLRSPKRKVVALEGIVRVPARRGKSALAALELPVDDIDEHGHVRSASGTGVVICRASSINLGLRAEAEKQALIEGFGRLLNSLDCGLQFVLRAGRLDIAEIICKLERDAGKLPHPLLEQAARDHASSLHTLSARGDLFRREAYVCIPMEGTRGQGLAQPRIEELRSLFRAIGIRIEPLTQTEAALLLRRAGDPMGPPPPAECALSPGVIGGAA